MNCPSQSKLCSAAIVIAHALCYSGFPFVLLVWRSLLPFESTAARHATANLLLLPVRQQQNLVCVAASLLHGLMHGNVNSHLADCNILRQGLCLAVQTELNIVKVKPPYKELKGQGIVSQQADEA